MSNHSLKFVGADEPRHGPPIQATPLDLVAVASSAGPVWLPKIMVDAMLAAGGGRITIEIKGETTGWITVTEAAQRHTTDRDDLSLETAKVRVTRAASRGAFRATGEGRDRRIDPISFDAWRLAEREADLDDDQE